MSKAVLFSWIGFVPKGLDVDGFKCEAVLLETLLLPLFRQNGRYY